MKKCPFCAEKIQDEAIVCRYCGRDLPQPESIPHEEISSTSGNKTTKKCIYCGKEIDTTSVYCRYCKKSQFKIEDENKPKKNNLAIIVVAIFIGIVLLGSLITNSRQNNENTNHLNDQTYLSSNEHYEYISIAKEYVTNILKTPSTASFPDEVKEKSKWSVSRNTSVVTITSYVDSENSFGARLRSSFKVQINHNSKELMCLVFDGELIYGKCH